MHPTIQTQTCVEHTSTTPIIQISHSRLDVYLYIYAYYYINLYKHKCTLIYAVNKRARLNELIDAWENIGENAEQNNRDYDIERE